MKGLMSLLFSAPQAAVSVLLAAFCTAAQHVKSSASVSQLHATVAEAATTVLLPSRLCRVSRRHTPSR